MGQDISIAFKASDNLTSSIRQMRKGVDGLSRDVSEYRKLQDQAFGKRSEVKIDISQAKKELKELERLIKAGDKSAEASFKEKHRQLDLLTEEYRRLGAAAREASKAESRLQDDISRSSNAAATRAPDLLRSLAGAGLGNMLGSAIAGNASQMAKSVWGDTAGSAVAGVAGSAFSGAAMGSVAGPIGSAVGAALGGLTGAIQALTDAQQKKDDLFRGEVEGLYAQVTQKQERDLNFGIEYESNREKNVMSFKTMLGSQESADALYQEIKDFGTNTPYQTASILNSAKQMLAYGVPVEELMDTMGMLGDVAMGDQLKLDSLAYAYSQIQSAGKLQGEDLLQLTSAGFNPLEFLAEERGTTLQVMKEQMSRGLISSEDVTHAFELAAQEDGRYFEATEALMDTYAGKESKLQDIQADIAGGYGMGYTEKRKEGLDAEIEWYGENLEQLKEDNALIGEFRAELENKHQQSIIEAKEKARQSEEYLKAEAVGDRTKMGEILLEAEIEGEIAYKNSEEYGLLQKADLALVNRLQEDVALNGAYLEYGRKKGEAFSKGWSGAIEGVVRQGLLPIEEEIRLEKEHGGLFDFIGATLAKTNLANANAVRTSIGVGSYATGLNRVPFNNMPAFLHEGERVLTRQEAQRQDRSLQGVHIAKLADSIVVREEADIDRIASALYSKLSRASESFVGN